MRGPEKVAVTSPDLIADQVERLWEIFLETFAEGKVGG